jgi:hypothetical protein
MSAPTKLISAQLVSDLATTLMRLYAARDDGDEIAELVAEDRLNYLIDRIPRSKG